MSNFNNASLIVTPNSKKAGKLYSLKGADLDVVRATTATYVGSDGLIKTAGINEVRFDYTNGSCPSILVEPQRTNLILRSEEFDDASWIKTRSVASSNTTISPSGSQDADTITETIFTNNFSGIERSITAVNGTTYTQSVFVKRGNIDFFSVGYFIINGANGRVIYNLNTKLVTLSENITSSSITDFANGWMRISITYTANASNANYVSYFHTKNSSSVNYNGDGTGFTQIWGAQLEAGSNATSYIPTTTTAVTRNLDVISKSGISSLIGQTEGTFYSEIQFFEGGARFNGIELFGNSGNRIYISKDTNDLIIVGFQANSIFTNVGSFNSSYNKIKIAIRYKSGNSVVYVNGVNVGSSSATFNFTTSINTLNCNVSNTSIYTLQGRLFSCCVFPLGLTNLQLQQLTTL